MTLESIAIISKSSGSDQDDLIYIQDFPNTKEKNDPRNDFEDNLFGYSISKHLNAEGLSSSLKNQCMLNSALDLFGNATAGGKEGGGEATTSTSGSGSGLYVGFICAMDDYRFYGE